jgi:hypothetical protein
MIQIEKPFEVPNKDILATLKFFVITSYLDTLYVHGLFSYCVLSLCLLYNKY